MPDPLSTLPKARRPHRNAFRKFVDLLKADPDLSRVIKTWVVHDGGPSDLDGAEESTGLNPCVRLAPEFPAWERLTITNVRDAPIDITIRTAINTTDWDDSANLWDAIEAAVVAAPFTVAMFAAGVHDVEVIGPAAIVNPTGEPFAVAVGKLRLQMCIR